MMPIDINVNTDMPYKQQKRNKPIASLIKWYIDKKSGKVSESRKEIQMRFDYLDWKDQKRILLAFLQAGKCDREWAYSRIYRQWDNCFLEPMKSLWEQYHENICAWSVIEHFPIEYVKENVPKLKEVNGQTNQLYMDIVMFRSLLLKAEWKYTLGRAY